MFSRFDMIPFGS